MSKEAETKTREEILKDHCVKVGIIGPDYPIEDEFSEEGMTAIIGAMQEYSFIQAKQALSKLPEALEIQYHAKRLSEVEFREYLDEYLKV